MSYLAASREPELSSQSASLFRKGLSLGHLSSQQVTDRQIGAAAGSVAWIATRAQIIRYWCKARAPESAAGSAFIVSRKARIAQKLYLRRYSQEAVSRLLIPVLGRIRETSGPGCYGLS